MPESGLANEVRADTQLGWLGAAAGLRRLILDWNYRPAAWGRLNRLRPATPPGLDLERLRATPKAERRLSGWLIRGWQLAEPYDFDFSRPVQRLALLPAERLESIAEKAGLLAHGRSMRLLITRDARASAVEALGEERFQFILARSQLYLDVTDGADGLRAERPATLSAPTLSDVARDGWSCLLAALDLYSAAFAERLLLKLPPHVAMEQQRYASPDPDPGAGRLLNRILKLEFPSEWEQICSS